MEKFLHSRYSLCCFYTAKSLCFPNSWTLQVSTSRKFVRNVDLRIAFRSNLYGTYLSTQIFDFIVHHFLDDLCAEFYITGEKYTTPEDKKKRCYTLVKWAYSLVYYLISSVWCYTILKQTTYLPTWLGGKGDPYEFFLDNRKVAEATF